MCGNFIGFFFPIDPIVYFFKIISNSEIPLFIYVVFVQLKNDDDS